MYRPEGWTEIIAKIAGKFVGEAVSYDDRVLEAGADAMLEGLKSGGVSIEALRDADIRYGGKLVPFLNGYLVFIPEEK